MVVLSYDSLFIFLLYLSIAFYDKQINLNLLNNSSKILFVLVFLSFVLTYIV